MYHDWFDTIIEGRNKAVKSKKTRSYIRATIGASPQVSTAGLFPPNPDMRENTFSYIAELFQDFAVREDYIRGEQSLCGRIYIPCLCYMESVNVKHMMVGPGQERIHE